MDLLTCSEAAAQLSYSTQHVRRLLRSGHLEGVKAGRDWIVSRASVDEFKARRENLRLPLSDHAS